MDSAGWRVLLVEDDPDIRELLTMTLDLAGYRVTAVPDAEKAWMHLQESGSDMLLTDYHLPGMLGDALVRELHRKFHNVPAVLMSARPDIGTVAGACGAEAVFCKGSAITDLLMAMQHAKNLQKV
jgi:DNA-binding NtrC family response regulator